MSTLIERIKPGLSRIGLNICGIAPGDDWLDIMPGCRSVVVFASGGRQLWEAFLGGLRANPKHLADEPDPLDSFIVRTLQAIDPEPPPSRRWIRCAADETVFVDFRVLGHQAGLGWQSKTGLLLHPEFGLWSALRLACFTTETLPPADPLPVPGPCGDCPAPCITACPSGAVSPSSPWDVDTCADFHVSSDHCRHTCHAREACPQGQQHRYPELESHYHSDRESGRIALGKHLNMRTRRPGAGPDWKDWTSGSKNR